MKSKKELFSSYSDRGIIIILDKSKSELILIFVRASEQTFRVLTRKRRIFAEDLVSQIHLNLD